jgi:hypothetical protein
MMFPLGTISVTFAASTALQAAGVHLHELLERHVSGDTGESAFEESALHQCEQIVSSYRLPGLGVQICVVTESDRRTTFVGFLEEYSR